MLVSCSTSCVLFSLAATTVYGQLEYLSTPEEVWSTGATDMNPGNGMFVSPDGSQLVGTFADGSIRFFDPSTGDSTTYTPDVLGWSMKGYSGVTFADNAPTPYLVYSVTDDPTDPTNATTRIIAVTPQGEPLYESVPIPGLPAGSPQTTFDGRYILMNTNINEAYGTFSLVDTSTATGSDPLEVLYSFTNETNPLSPIGVFHNPAEGYYDGGQGNTNDIFVWGFDTASDATEVGVGQVYAFQLPMSSDGTISVIPLGEERDFQSSTAPVLTNEGRSMYWATTRAEQRCWVGSATTNMARFNRSRTNTANFERGYPRFISARVSPSLSSDTAEPVVYGAGAYNQVFRLNYNYTENVTATTSAIISSRIAVSPDDQVIYYAAQNGDVAQLDGTTLETKWQYTMKSPVYGDIALNQAGTILYVADTSGMVVALQVAKATGPTPQPELAGISDVPSMVPSTVKLEEPTVSDAPSYVPTISPGTSEEPGANGAPSSPPETSPTVRNRTRTSTSSSNIVAGAGVASSMLAIIAFFWATL